MKQELENMKSLLNDLSSAIDDAFENYKPEEKPVAGWRKITTVSSHLFLAFSKDGKTF